MTEEHRTEAESAAAQNNAAAQAIFQLFQNWLTRVESKIDNVTGKLESKADRSDVAALSERIEGKATKAEVAELRSRVERESDRIDAVDKLTGLQGQRNNDQTEWHRWVVPVILTLVYVGATVYAVFQHH